MNGSVVGRMAQKLADDMLVRTKYDDVNRLLHTIPNFKRKIPQPHRVHSKHETMAFF